MEENNFIFYLKRWFLNRYLLLVAVVAMTAVLFVFNQKKLLKMVDLNDEAEEEYQIALAEQQAELAALGLDRDPGQLSYVEIMQSKDYDFSDQETLKLQDSDGDSLNDYEEIYIYQTSAFLEDTDGDKISDPVEIKAGTDPLCAEGEACGTDSLEKDLAQKASLVEDFYVADESGLDSVVNDISSIDVTEMDPAFLREALLESGVSSADLDALSDDEVIQLYQMAMEEYNSTESSSSSDYSAITIDDLMEIPIDDLRAALLSEGMSSEELSALSDEEVYAIYEKALTEYQAGEEDGEEIVIEDDDLANLTVDEIRYLLIQQGADEASLSEISDEDLMALFNEAMVESE